MIPVCPKCDSKLLILRLKSIEVDFCDHCRGIWLDAGELEQLMTATGAQTDDPLLRSLNQPTGQVRTVKHLCARCDEHLQEFSVGANLVLDRCARGHGLWFDGDELQQLLALFPRTSGAGRTIDFLNAIFGKSPKP